jgi:hypothetical protein
MKREIDTGRTLQRTATELGVPAASSYSKGAHAPSASEAMQNAVSALLSAFAMLSDPEERQRGVTRLDDEAKRLGGLPGCDR